MISNLLNLRRRVSAVMMVIAALPSAALRGQLSEKTVAELQEKLSKAGIFLRADAPAALRNTEDIYLPVYLEVINGVEKTARTTGAGASQFIKREPLALEGVNIYAKPAGARRQFASDPLLLGSSKEFTLDLRSNGQPLSIADRMKRTLEIPLAAIAKYLAQHYVGGPFQVADLCVAFRAAGWPSQNIYLRVRLGAPPLPQISNWSRGDAHYHSAFTDNPAERGYPLDVTKQAALHAGLNWIILTDHSTDLSPEKYAEELREAAKYRDGRFLFVRGEEVTVASNKQALLTTLHMVAMPSPDDPDKGFPDPAQRDGSSVILTGDGSVSSPALPLKDALSRIAAAGGFAYAAHPFDPISPVVRGGSWDLDLDFLAGDGKRLPSGLVGLEAWNRATTATADDARDPFCLRRDADPKTCFQPDKDANHYARLEKAIEQGWRPLLVKGLAAAGDAADSRPFKVFLAAGSDAHGDFNYEATMDVVDFLGKPSRGLTGYAEDNALGKLATVAYCPNGMGRRGENLLLALREGRTVLSNGPLLVSGFDRNSNGSLDDAEDIRIGQEISSSLQTLPPLQLLWASSNEFGPFKSIRLLVGSGAGESPPAEIAIPSSKGLNSGGLFAIDLRPYLEKLGTSWSYLRLEGRARNSGGEEFRCYTNPIWVRITER